MEVGKVYIADVKVGARHRQVDPQRAKDLADSIERLGLMTPISVWAPDQYTVELVAGLHRLRACERLGWEEIPCIFVNMGEVEREMWELAENLHRAELTVLERGEHEDRWVELAKVRKLSAPVPGGQQPNEEGIREAARELGVDERALRNRRKISREITPEAKEAARETGIDDNQSALLKVAAEDAERQVEKVRELARRKEQRKQIADAQDAINKHDGADVAADILAAYIPEDEHDRLIASLATTSTKDLIRAFKRVFADRPAA